MKICAKFFWLFSLHGSYWKKTFLKKFLVVLWLIIIKSFLFFFAFFRFFTEKLWIVLMHFFLGGKVLVGRALCNFLQKFIILGPLLTFSQSSHFGPASAKLHTFDRSLIGFVMLSVVDPEDFGFLLICTPDACRYSVKNVFISLVADLAPLGKTPVQCKTPLALASFSPNFPFPWQTATAAEKCSSARTAIVTESKCPESFASRSYPPSSLSGSTFFKLCPLCLEILVFGSWWWCCCSWSNK